MNTPKLSLAALTSQAHLVNIIDPYTLSVSFTALELRLQGFYKANKILALRNAGFPELMPDTSGFLCGSTTAQIEVEELGIVTIGIYIILT